MIDLSRGWSLQTDVRGNAMFIGNDHRIYLERRWDPVRATDTADGEPFALHIGMNPSRADAEHDDLTVRKDIEFTRRMGLRRMFKMNIGTFISTDPAGLERALSVNHPENLPWIIALAEMAIKVVIATGEPPDVLKGHARVLLNALRMTRVRMECFGLTKGGWPKHSSRLAYATPLVEFAW